MRRLSTLGIAVMMVAAIGFAANSAFGAPKLEVTNTNPASGEQSVEWGPPIGWSAGHGETCNDENDEDAGFACIHVGVPAGSKKITFSAAVDVSQLDPGLKLVPMLASLNAQFSEVGIMQTQEFKGGTKGFQKFELSGDITKEDGTWFLIPIFKVRVMDKPVNAFVGNVDVTSKVFIDDVSVKFDGKEQLTNGGFEDGTLKEGFAIAQQGQWMTPTCGGESAPEAAAASAPAEEPAF